MSNRFPSLSRNSTSKRTTSGPPSNSSSHCSKILRPSSSGVALKNRNWGTRRGGKGRGGKGRGKERRGGEGRGGEGRGGEGRGGEGRGGEGRGGERI